MSMRPTQIGLLFAVFSCLSLSFDDCVGECWQSEVDYGAQSSIQFVHVVDHVSHHNAEISDDQSSTASELTRSTHSSRYYELAGSTHSETAAKINKFVASHPSVREVVPCSSLDVAGVTLLAAELRPFMDNSMWQSFPEDDGRQLHINPWKTTEVGLRSELHRDALCAETQKLWAHHIRADTKDSSMDVVLPSLPVADFEKLGLDITELAIESRAYNKSLSCVAGHAAAEFNVGEDAYGYDWPHWPSTGHWRAKGHGPYPFWQFGPPESEWHLNESFASPYLYNPGNEMEVWHSTPLKATKFYHSACRWEWLGFPELEMHACVGLMLESFSPAGQWYVYTADPDTKATDENFCCDSTWRNFNGLHLGTINRKFVDDMIYVGEADYSGDYYTGRAKRYILAMDFSNLTCPECGDEPTLPINVFYETDLEGKPLRFGEWGQDLELNGYLHDTDLPLMYEEMDPNSWDDKEMQTFSNDVFAVPKVCSTDLHGCNPGRTNRETPDSVNFGST